MRTSKAKAAIVALLSLAFLVLLDIALTLVLVPYGSKSEIVWADYAQQEELDTVMVGSSVMQYALNPYILDELSGTRSLCLATPDQSLEESLIGIQTAYEDHRIKRAILSVTLESLRNTGAPSLGGAFLQQRSRVVSLPQSLEAAGQVLFRYGGASQADSLNAVCPWVFNRVKFSPKELAKNVKNRLGKSAHEATDSIDSQWTYVGKGFGINKKKVDPNNDKVIPLFSGLYEDDDGQPIAEIDPDPLRALRDLSAYCDEKGIDLVVVYVPLPDFDVVDRDGYFQLHDAIEAALADCGRELYDFNYARPELFANDVGYYYDRQHLNEKGSKAFTESFARLLAKRDAGEDTASLFYDGDEKRASIDYVAAVFADASVEGPVVHVGARAATGSNVQVEYRLCVRGSNGAYEPVTEWSSEPSFDYEPSKRGTVKLRVYARKAGAGGEGDCHRNVKVYY